MAGATSQLTISKAIEIAYQNKHNHIDPALATFLDQTIDGIWQRVKAQPSTYLFTREEFAVFTYYRSRFDDNEIAQQAVRRFWELQVSSQPTGAMSADMYLPPLEGDPKLWHEQVFREHPERLPLANSISVAPEKTASERLTLACQGCRKRRIRCDKKRPVCTSCWVRDITSECYYHGRIKDERLAGPNANADESNGFRLKTPRSISFRRRKVAADQIKEIEAKKFIEESEVKTPEDNLKKQSHIVESRDSSFERQKQQTSAIGEVDNGHLETADTSRMHATNGEEFTLVNSIKLYVESLTGEAWDWWPLRPSFRQLLEDEIRIQWHCVSYDPHSLVPSMLKV